MVTLIEVFQTLRNHIRHLNLHNSKNLLSLSFSPSCQSSSSSVNFKRGCSSRQRGTRASGLGSDHGTENCHRIKVLLKYQSHSILIKSFASAACIFLCLSSFQTLLVMSCWCQLPAQIQPEGDLWQNFQQTN